ncbi:hypothetical protein LBMAG21_17030 [Armatimonadota bacterium]|nr:hypothetical protein LBMAG21_17030 [Armatimonadota bacterium]
MTVIQTDVHIDFVASFMSNLDFCLKTREAKDISLLQKSYYHTK